VNRSVIVIGCAAIAIAAIAFKLATRDVPKSPDAAVEQIPGAQVHSSDIVIDADAGSTSSDLRTLTPVQASRREAQVSNTPPAQAPQTYVGPDGKEHAIVYNQGLNLDARGVQQMKAEIITDMRAHPDTFVGLYGLERSDVDAIVAGKKDLPKEMLANLVM
jgi:hypothetical protein